MTKEEFEKSQRDDPYRQGYFAGWNSGFQHGQTRLMDEIQDTLSRYLELTKRRPSPFESELAKALARANPMRGRKIIRPEPKW